MPPAAPAISAPPRAFGRAEILALTVTALWLGGVGWLFLDRRVSMPEAAPAIAGTLLLILLPVALIWLAAMLARTARTLRAESRELAVAIDTLRNDAARRGMGARLEAVTRAQTALAADFAALTAQGTPLAAPGRPIMPQAMAMAEPPQPALALETAPDGDALAPEDFIRALDFPDDERDEDGFRVLRAALRHRPTAQLAATAQDVLTRLAQDGVYMDDLTVHPADPVLWRAFASGERGADIAGIGGIRDRSSLALTTGRIRDDPGFRDAIHRFLRCFDIVFSDFAATATESELIRFADTRTARAFMLCARAVGTFDATGPDR